MKKMDFESILTQIAYDFGMKLEDLAFCISTESFDFPFSFFAFEDDDFLGILCTDENGAEKLHIIVKSEIVYIKIHYLDEIEFLFENEDNEHMVNKGYH